MGEKNGEIEHESCWGARGARTANIRPETWVDHLGRDIGTYETSKISPTQLGASVPGGSVVVLLTFQNKVQIIILPKQYIYCPLNVILKDRRSESVPDHDPSTPPPFLLLVPAAGEECKQFFASSFLNGLCENHKAAEPLQRGGKMSFVLKLEIISVSPCQQ